jgi:hypothetical protein
MYYNEIYNIIGYCTIYDTENLYISSKHASHYFMNILCYK